MPSLVSREFSKKTKPPQKAKFVSNGTDYGGFLLSINIASHFQRSFFWKVSMYRYSIILLFNTHICILKIQRVRTFKVLTRTNNFGMIVLNTWLNITVSYQDCHHAAQMLFSIKAVVVFLCGSFSPSNSAICVTAIFLLFNKCSLHTHLLVNQQVKLRIKTNNNFESFLNATRIA